jgi:putative ABC transport system permease protein
MWFFTLVFRNVGQRKIRSALTCLGMAVAVCAVVTMVGISDVFENAVSQLLETRGVDMVVSRAGAAQRSASTLDASLREKIAQVTGVKSVEGMLVDVVSFEDANLLAVYVLGCEPGGIMLNDQEIKSGRGIQADDQGKRVTVLGSILAEGLGKNVGDTVEIEFEEFDVIGVRESFNMFENSNALVPLDQLQKFMDREGQVTGFFVVADDVENKDELIKQLQHEIEKLTDDEGKTLGLSAMPTQDHVKSTIELRIVQGMAWSTSVIALFIGVIGMLNTMMISVFERMRELGALRALGWPKSLVVRMILLETFFLALAGAGLGMLGSIALIRFLNEFQAASGLIIPPSISPELMLKALLLAVVAGMLGATYPAYVAARLLPTEAVRHD